MKRIMKRALSFTLMLALLLAAVGFLSPVEDTLTVSAALKEPPVFSAQTDRNNIIGKSITGYQVWFGRNWYHNWGNSADGRNLFFEQYPSVGDYPAESLWKSNFGTLNNGETAYLFDSTDAGVIDTHLKWMQQNNIDCAAIQRFYGYARDNYSSSFAYLKTIMQKAERYQRTFYLMYDMSGAGGKSTNEVVSRIQNDFINNIEGQGLVSSPAYGHADGKPVVCLWGLSGVDTNYPDATTAYQLVTWFKERGYYVIIGTPDNGFSKATDAYADVYAAADMISPWYVGRYNMSGVGSTLRNNVITDKGYCDEKGIEFLPVIFPGFAWTNLKGVDKYNEIARNAGQFLWRQAIVLAMYGCETVYFAMFDEYDEATSLMKAATDFTMLPKGNSYFLTLAADGYWLSDDYYLRLAGAIGEMLDDVAAGKVNPSDIIADIPIPFSEGPVYYRNGFTYKVVTIENDAGETSEIPVRIDPGVCTSPYSFPARGSELIELTQYDEAVHGGGDDWWYHFAGESTATADATGRVHRLLSQTNFVLAEDTVLSYTLTASNQNGEKVFINLGFEDGTLLSQEMVSVKDTGVKVGNSMRVTVPISNDLAGRTVTSILISCELNESGAFSADVDDILIEIGEEGAGDFEAVPAPAEAMLGDVDGDEKITSTDARLTLQYYASKIDEEDLDITVADVDGDGNITSTDARLILQLYASKIEKFPAE